MSVEAHKCNAPGCKGFIVFDNADFNLNNPPTVDGLQSLDEPVCTECGKQFKVIPHYVVVYIDENGEVENNIKSSCFTAFERRKIELDYEREEIPYNKIEKFIRMRGYSYSVESVKEGYLAKNSNFYISHTMKDCVTNLERELDELYGHLI